jgi:hypothetical protein
MHRFALITSLLLTALGFSTARPLAAQEPPQAPEEAGRWDLRVPVTSSPPAIDGRLDDAVWADAAVIDQLTQIDPREGEPASEESRVLFLVDEDNLYIGFDFRDSDPEGIRGSQIVRDANLDPDDRVEIILDTFLDRRNAYFFQIGPGGSKGDALIGNNGSFFLKAWDGIWEGRARVHDGGWSAEMAIPAKTLSVAPGLDTWGFNMTRHIKRKNEQAQWASPSRRTRMFNVTGAGTLHGMSVLRRGVGLDVVPFVSAQGSRRHPSPRNPEAGDSSEIEPGLDVRYRVTSGLTASATINTDFAEAEVDNRVVNLTRFPVFFPEKRDFFLEDATIFDLGLGDALVPFFSRRIGLSADGSQVPILAGGKLTGRVGDWNIGLLDVQTDDVSDTVGGQNLAVARVTRNVLAESVVGGVVTHGDPNGQGDNLLTGLDFTYRTRRFRGDRNMVFQAFALGSRDEPEGEAAEDGHAVGLTLDFPNDVLAGGMGVREISEDFRPALGFVRRRGVRQVFGGFRYRFRPPDDGRFGKVRVFNLGPDVEVFEDIETGQVETAVVALEPLDVRFDSGDGFDVNLQHVEERLFAPFEIREGIVLAPGRYTFERYLAGFASADKRKVAGGVVLDTGTFFDGRRDRLSTYLILRAWQGVDAEIEWENNDVRLPAGDFTTNLVRARLRLDFTPEISWNNFLQWDDTTETVGVNSRVRWIVRPGQDVFFVINRGFDTRDEVRNLTLRPVDTDVTLKAEYTWRF